MFSSVKACVKVNSGTKTELFETSAGVRQGCMLSPILFIFFINDLVTEMYRNCQSGIFISQDIEDLMLLLFADDVVLFAYNVVSLQRQLDVLEAFCIKWGFQINFKKSEIVVFRNGGILNRFEKWYFNGSLLKTTPYYKYLGVIFSSRLIWTKSCENLAAQAVKACIPVYKLFQRNSFLSFSAACKIFDSKISPILLYGAEI